MSVSLIVNWHWRNILRMELLEPIVESFYHSLDTAPVFWRFRLLLGPFRFKSKKTSPNLLFIEGSLLSLCLCLWSQHCSTFQQDQTKPDCIQYRLFQVVLAGTSTKAVAAVKDLIYSGTCHLDEVALSQFKVELLHISFIISLTCLRFWRPWMSLE